jgi:hypothetical protein
MFYDKDKKLQKEFNSFWEELTKFEEEEDDDENEVPSQPSNNQTSSSAPNPLTDSSQTPSISTSSTRPTPSRATKLGVRRGDRTAKMNAMNDWISQQWETQAPELQDKVRTELEDEHQKATALWNSRKEWSGTPIDFARLVPPVFLVNTFSPYARAQIALHELAGNVLDTIASLIGGVTVLHVAYFEHETGHLRVRS